MEALPATVLAADVRESSSESTRVIRRGYDPALRRLLLVGDALGMVLALAAALSIPSAPAHGHKFVWGLVALPGMLVLFKLYGLYDRDVKRISHSTVDDLPWLFHATVIGGLILWLFSRLTPLRQLDFAEIVLFGIGVMAFVTTGRVIVRTLARRIIGWEAALLVGGGEMAQALVGKLAAHPEYRLRVIGTLSLDGAMTSHDQTGPGMAKNLDELPNLGTLEELEAVAALAGVTRVVFCARDVDEPELERLLRRCRAMSLKVSVLPRLADVLGPGVEIDDVEGVTVLGVNPPWLPRSSRGVKRAMDVVVAASLLLITSPLMLLSAIAIKIDSRGPVFFRQERVGKGGRRFKLFKFRTMVPNAEALRAQLLSQSTDRNWLKIDRDPRITRVGHRLRRLSLDELPQLWNVLRGEMSMVGPRPLIPAEDELILGWARGRLDLTPGITGYWQVLGRTRIPFEEMIKLDYLYVMNWSLWEDVRLMLRTLPIVIRGRGAN